MKIRLRLTMAFTLVAAACVLLGGFIFAREMRESLTRSIDAALRTRAQAEAASLAASGRPDVEGVSASFPGDPIVEVVAPGGEVTASAGAAGALPASTSAPGPQAIERSGFRIHVLAVQRPEGRWLVRVGQSLAPVRAAERQVVHELLAAGLALVALAGAGAWVLGGRALAPVEALRSEVAGLVKEDTGASLAVPGTGDEIALLAATMNDLLARLHGALTRERRLVADAAHELRTPLARLRTELELAERPGRSRDQLAAAVTLASAEAVRLSQLADDLLFLARVDEGVPVLRAETQPVAPILESAAGAFGNEVTIDVPANLCAMIDPGRLRRAVDNLLTNAARVAPAGSVINLAARADGEHLVVEVADRGPGFTEDFLPHAFERFRRGDPARARQDGGAGLGLAIVAAIAEAHGGTATAANRVDGGAIVRIYLPTERI